MPEDLSDAEEWAKVGVGVGAQCECRLEDVLAYPEKGTCGMTFSGRDPLNIHRLKMHNREDLTMLKSGSGQGRSMRDRRSLRLKEAEGNVPSLDELPRGLESRKMMLLQDQNKHIVDKAERNAMCAVQFAAWKKAYLELRKENDLKKQERVKRRTSSLQEMKDELKRKEKRRKRVDEESNSVEIEQDVESPGA